MTTTDLTYPTVTEPVPSEPVPVLIIDSPETEDTKPGVWESIEMKADELVDEIEKLVEEGTVRRIVVKHDGKVIIDFPLVVGVVGAVFAAPLAGIAAIAAVITDCTLEVERDVPKPETPEPVTETPDFVADSFFDTPEVV